MTTTDIVVVEQEYLTQAASLVDAAKLITVNSQEDFEKAAEFGKQTSTFIKKDW
jgi:hypothetical protein